MNTKRITKILSFFLLSFLFLPNIVNADTPTTYKIQFEDNIKNSFDTKVLELSINEFSEHLTLPETFESTVEVNSDTYYKKIDSETYYFNSDKDNNDLYSYSFTGWKIKGTDKNIASVTVFQPDNLISYETIKNYDTDSDGTLVLEALWGKVVYAENPYERMYYTDHWILDLEYTKANFNPTGSWNYKYENDTLTLNDGKDYDNPLSTFDYAFYMIYQNGTKDVYENVLMLTGNLDYVKSSNNGLGKSPYYFTKYDIYNETSGYDETKHYIFGEYVAQQVHFGYTGFYNASKTLSTTMSGTNGILYSPGVTIKSAQDRDTNYYLYGNGHGYGDRYNGSIRYDNIKFHTIPNTTDYRPKKSSPVSVAGEMQYYSGEDSTVEFTSRVTTSGYTFRPYTVQNVTVNGGTFNSMQFAYSSNMGSKTKPLAYDVNWFIGNKASISGALTIGQTSSYTSNTTATNVNNVNLIITGGTIGSIYGTGNGIMSTGHGNRNYKIYGDKSGVTKRDPKIGNLYGAGNQGKHYGNTNINIQGSTNITNVYGGGFAFTATLYGDTNINIKNSTIKNNVFGGGYNGNILKNDNGNGGNVNLNIESSNVLGNIFGSGMGGTQTLTSTITLGASQASKNWQNETFVPNDDFFKGVKNAANGDYNTDWSWSLPATGFPFMQKDTGYIATSVYKATNWTSNQTDYITFYRYYTYAYLSLAQIDNDVNININNSKIGVEGNTSKGNIYGGGSVAVVNGNVDINITNNSTIYNSVYSGGDGVTQPGKVTVYKPNDSENYKAPSYTVTEDASGNLNVKVESEANTYTKYKYSSPFSWSKDDYLLTTEYNGIDTENFKLYSENVGDLGIINGNTDLLISNSTVKGNAFGGGNAADIKGNSKITIDGDTTIEGNVFGGGNEGHVGEEDKNTSSTEINIVGGTINGNVYGGGNTSKVFGKTNINIGSNAVSDTSLTPHNIKINGTIFGGGEANASGSDEYDFSYIAVTDGVEINIDAKDYDTFDITGSIFGSGNASTSEGTSIINISNYGTNEAIKKNISIQRASIVTIDNSNIDLSGTTDRTNEFSNEIFTISRVDEFIIKNDSYLYLENGTNLLKKWTSKNNDSLTTKDNMNHLYIAPGKNMKVTTSQDATSYGVVEGITYLGIYDPTTYDKGIYDEDTKTTTTFTNGIYVLGAHSNDPETNGFVSSFEEDTIIDDYVTPVPEGQSYHIWKVGGEVYLESISLTASKYEVLGGYANVVFPLSSSDTSYSITDVDITGLVSGVNIINPSDIKDVYENNEDALNNIGVVMRTSSGWAEENSFVLLSENNGSFIGEESFLTESSDRKPNMEFYIYNAKNITENKDLGYFKVTLEAIKQVSALEREFKTVIITINLDTAYYEDFHYEGQIAPGAKFEKFGSAATNINTESSFSTYFESNTFSSSNPYQGNYERVVISSFPFKANTTIKMIDIVNNKFYYYNVTTSDEESGKTEYLLKDFYEMGSTTKKYNDKTNYYDSNTKLIKEEFIFTVSFENTTGQTESLNNTFFLNLREQSRAISITPNDSALSNMNYNLLIGDNSYTLSNTITSSTIREDEELDFILNVEVKPANSNLIDIEDTKNQFKKQGLKLTFYQNGVKLSPEKLLGVALVIDDKEYYVNSNGEIAVVLQNKINSITKSMSIKGLDVGTYTVKEEYAISSSGLYFSDSLATTEANITIKKNNYGIKVKEETDKVVHKDNNNSIDFKINYNSDLDNPNIRLTLSKKLLKSAYNYDYSDVIINDYVTNKKKKKTETEVVISNNPTSTQSISLKPTDLMTVGTYKFTFKLYDNNKYIGEYIVYKIIK